VQKARDRSVEWILDLPSKLFYAADDVLSRHVREAEADACYEALSLLYVAFTRAKRATYAIVEPVGKSKSRNYPKLLMETLGDEQRDVQIGNLILPGVWTEGDAAWHTGLTAHSAVEAPSSLNPLKTGAIAPIVRRDVRRPSGEAPRRVPAAQLFALEAGGAAEFGAKVHSLLAEVEWRKGVGMAEVWSARGEPAAEVAEAEVCLLAPALEAVWVQPTRAEVWRERAFEIVLDDAWVSGVFDRVIVERDANNRAEWVTVFDFKTDRVEDERAVADATRRHAAQLNVYRRVAAVLTGVPIDAVTCELVFTRVQRRVRVPAE
jgi:ATP-dependent helicase/nuclease subunit A